MKERIAELLIAEGLSASKFAETVGVQPSGISHILSGRNKPGYDLIVKILENFPHINPDWLLLGKRSMYRDGHTKTENRAAGFFERDGRHTVSAEAGTDKHGQDMANEQPTLFDDAAKRAGIASVATHAPISASTNIPVRTRGQVPEITAAPVSTPEKLEKSISFDHYDPQVQTPVATVSNAGIPATSDTSGSRATGCAEIERVMIFYSDSSVSSYIPKK
jgi:transcriptional regulator with XRE-family HTH domain